MGSRGASSGMSKIPPSNVTGRKKKDYFFGEVEQTSNKYMKFDQVKDEDNAIIMTNNVKVIKGNMVLITGKNTAVYLKDWQYQLMKTREQDEAFAVKINRNYFKEYTFKNGFEDYGGEHETFDSLWKTAAQQQRRGTKWRKGKMVIIMQNYWHELR